MSTAYEGMKANLRGKDSASDLAYARAYQWLRSTGMSDAQARKIIEIAPIEGGTPDQVASAVSRARKSFERRYGNVKIEDLDPARLNEEYYYNLLTARGASDEDAERLLDMTRITENKPENMRRLGANATRLGIDIGQPRLASKEPREPREPAPPKQGRVFRKPGTSDEVLVEQESLRDILMEHGASAEDAQRILDTASITTTNRRANLEKLRRAADFEEVPIQWPTLRGQSGDALPGTAGTPGAAPMAAVDKVIRKQVGALGDWLSSRPAPGGIGGPLLVMFILWFAVIKVWGQKTRLALIWDTLTGEANLDVDPNVEFDKSVPVPGLEAVVEKIIDDASPTIANAIHSGITGGAVDATKKMAGLPGTALNDLSAGMNQAALAGHHELGKLFGAAESALTGAGGATSAGYDARRGF